MKCILFGEWVLENISFSITAIPYTVGVNDRADKSFLQAAYRTTNDILHNIDADCDIIHKYVCQHLPCRTAAQIWWGWAIDKSLAEFRS